MYRSLSVPTWDALSLSLSLLFYFPKSSYDQKYDEVTGKGQYLLFSVSDLSWYHN